MKIQSEIQVPNDHTKKSFQVISAEYDLLIRIEACVLDAFEAALVVDTLNYAIGDPEVLSLPYRFDQSPNCAYP